jgi:hypothetical protein
MKRALPLVVAIVATTMFSGASAASAQVSSASLSQGQPDNPGKADPPGLAKGHDKEPAGQQKAKKSTAKPTPKAKPAPKAKAKPAPKPANPGKAKGHDKGKAQGKAVGHGRSTTGAPAAPQGRGSNNENKKITFCHVPPGNPANGHLITTSVNAITPGHTNHPGDIIPPFSFVKHGSTVTFAGQNWDAAGQATLNNGCKPVPASGAGTVEDPTTAPGFQASPDRFARRRPRRPAGRGDPRAGHGHWRSGHRRSGHRHLDDVRCCRHADRRQHRRPGAAEHRWSSPGRAAGRHRPGRRRRRARDASPSDGLTSNH